MWGRKVNSGSREGASFEVAKLSIFRIAHHFHNPRQRCLTIQKAEMLFMYGRTNGNVGEALRLYRMCFLNRALPDRTAFQRLHKQISETVSFRGEIQCTSQPRITRSTNQVKVFMETVRNQPERSTRSTAQEQRVHHTTVWWFPTDRQMTCAAWGKVPLPSPVGPGLVDNWFFRNV